jgi:exosortase
MLSYVSSRIMADTDNKPTWLEELRQESSQCWRIMPDKIPLGILLGAWFALFHFWGNPTFGYVRTASLFGWLSNAYNVPQSEDSHGNLIPFVVLGIWWWKRKEWLPLPKEPWWPALFGVAASLALHLLGYLIQQPRLSAVAFFSGLYFLTGLAWGKAWLKAVFFPWVLFAFCIPVGNLAEGLTFPLRMVVTRISHFLSSQVMGIAVVRDGTQLLDPRGFYQYDVAAPCSGMRSLVAMFALTTIYAFVTFQTTWKRLLLVAMTLPLAVAGNVLRITSIIMAAQAFGRTAGDRVHEGSGYFTFLLAIVCLLLLGRLLREEPAQPTGGAA